MPLNRMNSCAIGALSAASSTNAAARSARQRLRTRGRARTSSSISIWASRGSCLKDWAIHAAWGLLGDDKIEAGRGQQEAEHVAPADVFAKHDDAEQRCD